MHVLKLETILSAVDTDDSSKTALRTAEDLAKAAGAALHVVHVESAKNHGVATGDRFDPAVIRATDARFHSLSGDPPTTIRDFAEHIGADVIVLGPHRTANANPAHPLGSTAMDVVTNAAAPILVAGARLYLPLRRVLVPVDLSDTARGALVVGLSWSSALRKARAGETTELDVLYIDQPDAAPAPGGQDEFEQELERIRHDAGSWASVEIKGETIRASDIATAIDERAREREADLVVIGTRGLGASRAAVGSVAAELLRRTRVPLLLVPPSVWKYSEKL